MHTNMQQRVLILGSCVSRDIFRVTKNNQFVLTDYYARSSFASAFHPVAIHDEWSPTLSSAFQRKMVRADLRKLWPRVISTQYDLLLVNFIDERFHLARQLHGEGVISLSNEIKSTGFDAKKNARAIIRFASDEHYALWEKGWARFIDLLTVQKKLKRLCLNKVYWASQVQSGLPVEWGYTSAQIDTANAYLDRLYQRVSEDIPATQVLNFNQKIFVGDENHLWGPSPYHYKEEYYYNALKMLIHAVRIVGAP